MAEKILCVDDDPNILAAYKRGLRKEFELDTAESGPKGLEEIARHGPYSVIVSDMQMPGMDGIEFLARVREIHPETVRVMLTGQTDVNVAMEAVNKGNIFRFLTKPCPPETLAMVLNAGIEQYRLVTAEKELLEKTLRGAVKVLSDVLSMVNPTAFGRASRVRRLVRQLCTQMGYDISWKVELGSMLSQVGCVTVPEAILKKVFEGKALLHEEMQMFSSHPSIGRDLISKIPRLEDVAGIIEYQEKHYDGKGLPKDSVNGSRIPLGARLLKVALDYDTLKTAGLSSFDAVTELGTRSGWYDSALIEALRAVLNLEITYVVKYVTIEELNSKMILAEDVYGSSGALLIANGQEVSSSLLIRIKNVAFTTGIKEPLKVFVPR